MPPRVKPDDEQTAALEDVRVAAAALEAAKQTRDQAIRAASDLGLSRRVVGEAADMSHARVQQILDGD